MNADMIHDWNSELTFEWHPGSRVESATTLVSNNAFPIVLIVALLVSCMLLMT